MEQKVDVCDVPVATVTDRFLAYAQDADHWDLEEVTWFLAMCAALLELKVGRLMPRHTEVDEDDLLGGSPTWRTRARSSWRPSAGSPSTSPALEDEAGYFTRDIGPGPEFSRLYPDPMARVEPTTWRRSPPVSATPPTLDLTHVTPIRYTMAEAITAVERRIEDFGRAASFRDLVADCDERIQVVVRFLALLELYRDGRVELDRGDVRGDPRPVAAMTNDDGNSGETRALEALLFVSDEPLPTSVIAQALEIDRSAVERLCERLTSDLEERGAGSCSGTSRAAGVCSPTRTPRRRWSGS